MRLRTAMLMSLLSMAAGLGAWGCADERNPSFADAGSDGPRADAPPPDVLARDTSPDVAADLSTDARGDAPRVDTATDQSSKVDVGSPPDRGSQADFDQSAAGLCATAPFVPLVNGSATINGNTKLFANEFSALRCRSTTSTTSYLSGPQAYYRIAGKAGQWYQFVLRPTYSSAYLYVFTSPLCTEQAIQTDCQSDGATGESSNTGATATSPRVIYFQAPQNGDIYVAVDSTSISYSGTFSLDIEELPAPTNGTCANAQPLVLFNDKAIVRGGTHQKMTPDEFPLLNCGLGGAMDGPQAYYSFNALAGQTYKIKLKNVAGYYLYYYVFGASCVEADIKADCSSGGATGLVDGSVYGGAEKEIVFNPTSAGTYHIAVDGTAPYYYGAFVLTVEAFTPPPNGKCATADPINLVAGKATINGSTLGLANEYGIAVDCTASVDYDGPQAYYKLSAQAGKAYKLTLEPTFSSAYWYVFRATSCSAAATINADCGSGGVSGANPGYVSTTGETLLFNPSTTGDYLIAIDSSGPTYAGAFTLNVEEFTPPQNGSCGQAEPITLVAGKATINGTTLGLVNEYGIAVDCTGSIDYDGPQAYYKLSTQAGKAYKVTFKPTYSSAYWYVFQAASCGTPSAMNASCGSAGISGDNPAFASTTGETIVLAPSIPGDVVIALDSSDPTYAGDFTLTVEEFTPPPNSRCAQAAPITLVGGKATINSTTLGVTNEYGISVDCTGSIDYDGPQTYYKLSAQAGKGYNLTFKPSYGSAYWYVFQASSCGTPSAINANCGSPGVSGDNPAFAATSGETIVFAPTTPGDYVIALDSSDVSYAGDFTLSVEEFAIPSNTSCATAAPLTLVNGSVTVASSTAVAKDEFPTLLCKAGVLTSSALDGPQLYWSLPMSVGKTYALSLTANYASAYLYVFDGGKPCSVANVAVDCQSSGISGLGLGPFSNSTRTLYFTPQATATYKIAADSYGVGGDVSLTVRELAPPTNDSCATAQTLTLVGNQASVSGFTVGAADEFVGAIKCGLGLHFAAGQTYHKVNLQAGVEHVIKVSTDHPAEVYLFRGSSACNSAAIEADCASKGVSGDHRSLTAVVGGTVQFGVTPTVSGDYYIVVDGRMAENVGAYDITVNAFVIPTLTAPFKLDLQGGSGGLAAAGDWEYGTLAFTGSGCTSATNVPPPGNVGHLPTHTKMWGTVLNGCFSDAGNNDGTCPTTACTSTNKADDSRLAFKVDLTQGACATATTAALRVWDYLHQANGCDRAMYFIDDVIDNAATICSGTSGGWRQVSIDLTAKLRSVVAVDLRWVASTGTNAAGWYVDEIEVVCQ